MSDIMTNLEAALDQARQELGSIQRVGRALGTWEEERVSKLQRVAELVQQAVDALQQPSSSGSGSITREDLGETRSGTIGGATAGTSGGATGGAMGEDRFDRRDLDMAEGALPGHDDTPDY